MTHCNRLLCDNHITKPNTYYRFLWVNYWYWGYTRTMKNRFCENCIKKGNTSITEYQAFKNNTT